MADELLRQNGIVIPQYRKEDDTGFEKLKGKNGGINVNVNGSLANITGALATVVTSGIRVQLPNIPCREVTVIAKRTNSGYVYIGGSNVSSSVYGVELSAKESYTFQVANTNQIYIDTSVSGEGISYVAI